MGLRSIDCHAAAFQSMLSGPSPGRASLRASGLDRAEAVLWLNRISQK
jgi:hypothetical protein